MESYYQIQKPICDIKTFAQLFANQCRIWGGGHGPKFSQFHAFFPEIWQNHICWGILDPPLLIAAHENEEN